MEIHNPKMSGHCSACGITVVSRDGVHVGNMGKSKLLCSRCYNESIAEYLDLDYKHIAFDPVTLEDQEGVSHTFQFRTHLFSDELSLDAFEVKEDGEGYEFSIIADAEQDLYISFKSLFERIRRGLSRRHIEYGDCGDQIKDGLVRGRITSEADDPLAPLLIIDGKPVSWDELRQMISTYMGFNFKLEIFDRSEEK
ncbi:MAG: hypothetical protein ABW185_09370 [Sedimenticola sp.]